MTSSRLKKAVEDAILAPTYDSRRYVDEYLKPHMKRFTQTVALLQKIARPEMRVIDVASYGSLMPALKDILGLVDITLTEPRQPNKTASEDSTLPNARYGHKYQFHIDRFDIGGSFPHRDSTFDIVLFTEVLEHLAVDPVHTLAEINRITKPGGWLLLSTPNCASAKSIAKILRGGNPNIYPFYTKQPLRDRHNREYVPWEVKELLRSCGYHVNLLKTVDVYDEGQQANFKFFLIKKALWLASFLSLGSIKAEDRGDTILALGKKTSAITDRYPAFLYV